MKKIDLILGSAVLMITILSIIAMIEVHRA